MGDVFSYAILGRGAWAHRMREILTREGRRVACIEETRREAAQLTDALRASGAEAAWLCVTPGPHVASMMRAAIDAGMHAIAEKPWMCSKDETEALERAAESRGVRLGVHFEYCLLAGVKGWRERFYEAHGLQFGGRFTVSRRDRLEIPAIENLGSHLAAIRRYAAPHSEIAELICAYEAPDERRVWIGSEAIHFFGTREPLIERFVQCFEESAEFPFGIDFALRVREDLLSYCARQTAVSHLR